MDEIKDADVAHDEDMPSADITTRPVEISTANDDLLCNYCDVEFRNMEDLVAHKKEIHDSPSKESTVLERYVCYFCVTMWLQLTITI